MLVPRLLIEGPLVVSRRKPSDEGAALIGGLAIVVPEELVEEPETITVVPVAVAPRELAE